MPQLIALNGFKRSGKNTVANLIAELVPGKTVQVGFADKVKHLSALALGYEGTDEELVLFMDHLKENGWVSSRLDDEFEGTQKVIPGRSYLQNVGSEARAVLGDTIWIDQVLPRVQWSSYNPGATFYPNTDVVVITDLRFPNEAERVLGLGGVVWRINRPGIDSDGHASEQRLEGNLVSEEIYNYSTIEDLKWKEVKPALDALLDD